MQQQSVQHSKRGEENWFGVRENMNNGGCLSVEVCLLLLFIYVSFLFSSITEHDRSKLKSKECVRERVSKGDGNRRNGMPGILFNFCIYLHLISV